MRALSVSVEYDDLLAVSLPRMMETFDDVLVVTTPEDAATRAVAEAHGARVHATRAFHRGGAEFNKGLALEEAFDAFGREGWLCVIDADVILPRGARAALAGLEPGKLYVPPRRMCRDARKWDGAEVWIEHPFRADREHGGWCQCFHADDPVLRERPWYGVRWRHAGGGDSEFQARWRPEDKVWLAWCVLHLGPEMTNWYGRTSDRLDGREIGPAAGRRRTAIGRMQCDRMRYGYARERL